MISRSLTTASICTATLFLFALASRAADSSDGVTLKAVTPNQYAKVLKAAKGNVILVDFWSTTCLPCRAQFPHTVALAKKFSDSGLSVVSMACDDESSHEKALKFLVKSKATLTNLRSALGAGDETYNAYSIDSGALPHYKLYDRTGKLRHTFAVDAAAEKQFTSEDIQAKVEELLAEK